MLFPLALLPFLELWGGRGAFGLFLFSTWCCLFVYTFFARLQALKRAKAPPFWVAIPAADPASGAARFELHYYVRSSAPADDLGELYGPSLRKRFRGNVFKEVHCQTQHVFRA